MSLSPVVTDRSVRFAAARGDRVVFNDASVRAVSSPSSFL